MFLSLLGLKDKMPLLDEWAVMLGTGVGLLAWMELRFITRRECSSRHVGIDESTKDRIQANEHRFSDIRTQLEERKIRVHELRDLINPMITDIALIKRDIVQFTRSIDALTAKLNEIKPPSQYDNSQS